MKLLEWIFPPKCVFCEMFIDTKTPFYVCEQCCEKYCNEKWRRCEICDIPLTAQYGDLICEKCRKKRPPYARHFAPLVYGGQVRSSLLASKFANKTVNFKTFALMTYYRIRSMDPELVFDCIAFVPLSAKRQAVRGYNQCRFFADNLAQLFCVPVVDVLVKTRDAPAQSKTALAMRESNAKGAYASKNLEAVKGKRVLLVDDVRTTGSTLIECTRVLMEGGVQKVFTASVAVISRGVCQHTLPRS